MLVSTALELDSNRKDFAKAIPQSGNFPGAIGQVVANPLVCQAWKKSRFLVPACLRKALLLAMRPVAEFRPADPAS